MKHIDSSTEMISRDEVLKILEEMKSWILKSGKLEAFGLLMNMLDRIKRLKITEVRIDGDADR